MWGSGFAWQDSIWFHLNRHKTPRDLVSSPSKRHPLMRFPALAFPMIYFSLQKVHESRLDHPKSNRMIGSGFAQEITCVSSKRGPVLSLDRPHYFTKCESRPFTCFQLCAENLSCCGRLGPVITRHRLRVDQNTKVLQRFPHRIIRSMRNADPVLTVLLESFDRIRKLSLIINKAAHLQSIIRPLRLNVIRFWVLPPVS